MAKHRERTVLVAALFQGCVVFVNAAAQPSASEELVAAARSTSVAEIEPGMRNVPVAEWLDQYADGFTSPSAVRLADCGERSAGATERDRTERSSVGAPVCASVVAELRTGGSVEIRFPIATALMDRAEDRSLHFAGIADGGVARTFESLDDLAGYLGYRQNMLMYWNPARHVVLAEVIETQYQPTNGHPILRHRGSVIRSYKGDWLEGDTIRFVTATEGRPDWFTLSDLVIHDPPRMQILFLEERTDAEIFVDIGWSSPYGGSLPTDLIIEDLGEAHRLDEQARASVTGISAR